MKKMIIFYAEWYYHFPGFPKPENLESNMHRRRWKEGSIGEGGNKDRALIKSNTRASWEPVFNFLFEKHTAPGFTK